MGRRKMEEERETKKERGGEGEERKRGKER